MQGAFSVTLPDNSIVFPSGQAKTKRFLNEEESKVQAIVDMVRLSCNNASELGENYLWKFVATVGMWGLNNVINVKNRQVDSSKCVGCGVCAIICPGHFISMVNGKPHFKKECFNCFGCAHWCPQGAISLGYLRPQSSTKYVHPGIPPKEFAGQIKLEFGK